MYANASRRIALSRAIYPSYSRAYAAVAPMRRPKAEGTIADAFASMSQKTDVPLPARFSDLKKDLWADKLVESWKDILKELEGAVEDRADSAGHRGRTRAEDGNATHGGCAFNTMSPAQG